MRLSNYLITEKRTEPIDIDDAVNIVKADAMDMVKNGVKIYRGTDSNLLTLFIDPSRFTRKSANTQNFYTILMDNLPSWKKYPKRSKSIICSVDRGIAENYGEAYCVFPFNGAKIGICPSNDIWGSFLPDIDDMSTFNGNLYGIAYVLGLGQKILEAKTLNELKSVFDKIDELKDSIRDTNIYTKVLNEYLKSNEPLFSLIEKALDPRTHHFRLVTPKTMPKSLSEAQEVWTDSASVLVSKNYIDTFLQKVNS